jgi:hypothetical protein
MQSDRYNSNTPQLFPPLAKPYGITYGQWTVRWWNWAFLSPSEFNPVVDHNGENAAVNQSGPVWFLAGTFGENRIPERSCKIPFGKAILFPVINYEMNALEDPTLTNEAQLIDHVRTDIDDIITMEAIVDGMKVPVHRIKSDPTVFDLVLGENNCLGIPSATTKSVADGYWVFLEPLSRGMHEINFHGSCSAGKRNSAAVYHLEVI